MDRWSILFTSSTTARHQLGRDERWFVQIPVANNALIHSTLNDFPFLQAQELTV